MSAEGGRDRSFPRERVEGGEGGGGGEGVRVERVKLRSFPGLRPTKNYADTWTARQAAYRKRPSAL